MTLGTTVKRHIGPSSETKPEGEPLGSTFYETDTGLTYFWGGRFWTTAVLGDDQSPLLSLLYTEMRIMNKHLSILTNEEFTEDDLEFVDG